MDKSFALYTFICSGNHIYINTEQSFQCLKVELQSKTRDMTYQCKSNANSSCSEQHPLTIVLAHRPELQQADHTLNFTLNSYKGTQKYRNSDNQVCQEFVIIPDTPLMKSTFCTLMIKCTSCFKKNIFVTYLYDTVNSLSTN